MIEQDKLDIGQFRIINESLADNHRIGFFMSTPTGSLVVQGKNRTIDILQLRDLTYMTTLDVNENSFLAGIVMGTKLFIGCSYNNLYVFNTSSNFMKAAKLETKEYIHQFI